MGRDGNWTPELNCIVRYTWNRRCAHMPLNALPVVVNACACVEMNSFQLELNWLSG